MREDFTEQPTHQMPQISGPHPLYGVALGKLREDSIYPVTKAAQKRAPFGVGISLLGGVRSQEIDTHPGQFLPCFGRMVVAVSENDSASSLDKLRHDGKLVSVGRSHRDAGDEPRPADSHVQPETIEGLPDEGVLAESGLPTEARAAVGTSEQASWQGHRVADGEGGIMGSKGEKLLPEALLELPEVGRLAGKGRPMHLAEDGEPFSIVTTEEEVDRLVGVLDPGTQRRPRW